MTVININQIKLEKTLEYVDDFKDYIKNNPQELAIIITADENQFSVLTTSMDLPELVLLLEKVKLNFLLESSSLFEN